MDTKTIDMVLYCPNCGKQHIDAPEHPHSWDNPPTDRTFATRAGAPGAPPTYPHGVASTKTGKADTWVGKFASPAEQPQGFHAENGDTLWLWKDGDDYLAFKHLHPCFSPGGDPMTLGKPFGRAEFRASHDRTTAPQPAFVQEIADARDAVAAWSEWVKVVTAASTLQPEREAPKPFWSR